MRTSTYVPSLVLAVTISIVATTAGSSAVLGGQTQGLRPPELAEYYVQIPLADLDRAKASPFWHDRQVAQGADQATVVLDWQTVTSLQDGGVRIRILKRKYSPQEFDALAHTPPSELGDYTLANDSLTMIFDSSGEFQMRLTVDGRYLLYPGFTSYISVVIDGSPYVAGSEDLPVIVPLSIVGNAATITYGSSENVVLTERYVLEGDACRFEMNVQNNDSTGHRVGVRYLLDTQIHENDGAPLYSPPTGTRTYEKEVLPLNFTEWQSWLDPILDPGDLRGIGTLTAVPDRVVFAWWPGAYTQIWDYTPDENQRFYTPGLSTSPQSDSCVLVYLDAGTVDVGRSSTVSTAYGLGSPFLPGDRDQLVRALTDLAEAVKNYQEAAASVFADASAYTALTIRRDQEVKKLTTDFFLDLAAGGEFSHSAAKFFTNPSSEASKWFIEKELGRIGDKLLIKGASKSLLKALEVWMLDPAYGGIDPNWTEDQTRTYIEDFINGRLAANQAAVDAALAAVVGDLPDPLPPNYPLDATIESLGRLRRQVMLLTPRVDEPREDVVYWAIPGLADFGIYGDYNPALIGVSGQISADHKSVVKRVLQAEGTLTTLRRGTCIGWTIGGGATKIALHIVSAGTGPGALPAGVGIEAFYWKGVLACDKAGKINAAVSLFAKSFATLMLGINLSDIESDADYTQAFFERVARATVQVATADLSASTTLMFGPLQARDILVGPFDFSGDGTASIEVENLDHARSGKARCLAEIHRRRAGSYRDLVGTGVSELGIAAGGSSTLAYGYSVPAGFLLTTDKYLMETNILSSGGYDYRAAYFRACTPQACWLDDQISHLRSGTIAQGESQSGIITTNGPAVEAEVSLSFPGSDLDLHLYDAVGHHVGVNYSTGEVENEIEGATYSGPQSNPEVVRFLNHGTNSFDYRVVALDTIGAEPYSVDVTQEAVHPARLVASPGKLELDVRRHQQATVSLQLMEVGGQQSAEVSDISVPDLMGPNGVFPRTSIFLSDPPSSVPAGDNVPVTITAEAGDSIPSGDYSGDLVIHWAGGAVNVPLTVHVLDCPYRTPSEIGEISLRSARLGSLQTTFPTTPFEAAGRSFDAGFALTKADVTGVVSTATFAGIPGAPSSLPLQSARVVWDVGLRALRIRGKVVFKSPTESCTLSLDGVRKGDILELAVRYSLRLASPSKMTVTGRFVTSSPLAIVGTTATVGCIDFQPLSSTDRTLSDPKVCLNLPWGQTAFGSAQQSRRIRRDRSGVETVGRTYRFTLTLSGGGSIILRTVPAAAGAQPPLPLSFISARIAGQPILPQEITIGWARACD